MRLEQAFVRRRFTLDSSAIASVLDWPRLPVDDVRVLQGLELGDSSAYDSTLMVGYRSSTGLGVEGGFKTFNLDLEDAGNLDTNLEYDGIYLNGYYRF